MTNRDALANERLVQSLYERLLIVVISANDIGGKLRQAHIN